MKDQPLRMFEYWVGEKGIEATLEDYYPNLLESDARINLLYKLHKDSLTQIVKHIGELEYE